VEKTFILKLHAVVVATFIFYTGAVAGQSSVENWSGEITFSPTSKTMVEVNLAKSDDLKITGTLAVPGQQGRQQNLQNIAIEGTSVSFDLSDGRTIATFKGTLAEDGQSLTGKFTQAGQSFPFEFSRRNGEVSTHPAKSTATTHE